MNCKPTPIIQPLEDVHRCITSQWNSAFRYEQTVLVIFGILTVGLWVPYKIWESFLPDLISVTILVVLYVPTFTCPLSIRKWQQNDTMNHFHLGLVIHDDFVPMTSKLVCVPDTCYTQFTASNMPCKIYRQIPVYIFEPGSDIIHIVTIIARNVMLWLLVKILQRRNLQ